MTDRVISFLKTLKSKEYRGNRKNVEYPDVTDDRFMNAALFLLRPKKRKRRFYIRAIFSASIARLKTRLETFRGE